jgi:hypothetical protein
MNRGATAAMADWVVVEIRVNQIIIHLLKQK